VRRSVAIGAAIAAVLVVLVPSSGAVYNGYAANSAKFPWLVTLTYNGAEYCGGALIAPRIALTVAHCVAGRLRAGTKVVFGFKSSHPTAVSITNVVEHGYDPATNLNDIAIVALSSQAGSAKAIRLVENDPKIGSSLTAVGFGCSAPPYVSPSTRCHRFPSHLQAVTLTRVRQDCKDMSATDFCTTGGQASTNHGDSGGPVMIRTGRVWQLAGLVDLDSSGTPTDDSPPFFEDMTSIARELPWIETVVDTGTAAHSLTVDPSSFGGMPNPGTLQQAIDHFGPPTTLFSEDSGVDCEVRWDDLGIRALLRGLRLARDQ
jgi:hypothetical protein